MALGSAHGPRLQAAQQGALMADEHRMELDWVNLPPDAEPQSLWRCLHDAKLQSVRSDRLEREVVLEFDVPHLRDFHSLPADLAFRFHLAGVSSVRAITFAHWPGPEPEGAGKSYDEQTRLVREYGEKGRYESVSWREFEEEFASVDFDVMDARLVSGDRELTLRIDGFLDGDDWHTLFLRADRLSVHRSDGVEFTLDQLQTLGGSIGMTLATGGAGTSFRRKRKAKQLKGRWETQQ